MSSQNIKPKSRSIHWYGWRPNLPDHRDLVYKTTARLLRLLPLKIDLRNDCPPVYNQGQLGSCTGNAIAAAIQFEQLKQKQNSRFIPSRLFIYYNERAIEGTITTDNGAEIRDGIKTVNKQGVCSESKWPYSDNTIQFKKKPTAACYTEALKHRIVQ